MPQVIGVENGTIGADESLQFRKIWVRHKKLSITYLVLSDDQTQTEDDILAASGIPPLFYPLNGCRCKKRTPKEDTRVIHPITGVAASLWKVECEFDSEVKAEDDQPPESKPPVVGWRGLTEEELLEDDAITGEPIQTTAEEPIFLKGPTTIPVLDITRYEQYPFDPDVMLRFANRTNSAPFWGAPVGTVWMEPMDVGEETIEQVKYNKVRYSLKFKIRYNAGGGMIPNTWLARPLNHGFKYRESANKAPVIYFDKHGHPATVNLAADGTRLPAESPPIRLAFNRTTQIDFNILSLGPF